MTNQDLDRLISDTIQKKPQFKSSIERMFNSIKALGDRNSEVAFKQYLKKICESDESEAALFVAKMDKLASATQHVQSNLEKDRWGATDAKEIIYNHFPQARRIVHSVLFLFVVLVGIVVYMVNR